LFLIPAVKEIRFSGVAFGESLPVMEMLKIIFIDGFPAFDFDGNQIIPLFVNTVNFVAEFISPKIERGEFSLVKSPFH
jgi:hypothetical protein